MGKLALLWALGGIVPAAPPEKTTLRRFEFQGVQMAVPVRLVLYSADSAGANRAAKAAFDRMGQLNSILSDYDPESEVRRLCDSSGRGEPFSVSNDLWRVLTHAQDLSRRTNGAFDVTVGPVVRLWRRARRQHELPAPDKLQQARQLVGYQLMELRWPERQVILKKPGMRLDLGGIAKGYVLEEALAVLREHGVSRALISAGGDIALGEPPPDRPGWTIGVATLRPDEPPGLYLSLSRCSVATSGDTWQYVEIGGRRYSHIVDPRTGYALTERTQLTVVAPDGMTADGLATALNVLGPQEGLRLVEETPRAAALVLQAQDGTLRTAQSSRWKDLPVVHPEPRPEFKPPAASGG
ncbi:MAG: FAD:protein FMN transferase [Thermoguttaceae bacterium]